MAHGSPLLENLRSSQEAKKMKKIVALTIKILCAVISFIAVHCHSNTAGAPGASAGFLAVKMLSVYEDYTLPKFRAAYALCGTISPFGRIDTGLRV
jgi:hypothetical protein